MKKGLLISFIIILTSIFLVSCKPKDDGNIWPGDQLTKWKLDNIYLSKDINVYSKVIDSDKAIISMNVEYETFIDLAKQFYDAGYKFYHNEEKDTYQTVGAYDRKLVLYDFFDQGKCFKACIKLSENEYVELEMKYLTSDNVVTIHVNL